ncbi:MAG: replication protein [Desulfosalsimonas sp.]|uniref:replication protein n=1 Tax=Desulfosalsimonas sp. TaxID=3073848 RepID=UPI003970A415
MTENYQKTGSKSRITDNYAKIPNGLLDRLTHLRIPGEQMQVLMVIIRKTYGWEKRSDWIALNQFAESTGISKRNVLRAIQALEERKIVIVVKNDNKKHPSYRINEKFNQWKALSKKTPLSKLTITGVKNDNAPLSNSPPTIDTPTIDTPTTDSSGCGCKNESEKETVHLEDEPPTVDSNRYGLSAEQLEYIDLKTEQAARAGKIEDTKEAYKHGLVKKAKDGLLDISGLDAMRTQPQNHGPHPSYLKPQDELEWAVANQRPWEFLGISESEWTTAARNGEIQYNCADSRYTLLLETPAPDGSLYAHVWPDGRVDREGQN